MHDHGSDGVHATFAEAEILDVYWGESKLYKSSSAAFKDCIESIAPFLDANDETARHRDILLVQDHLNVDQYRWQLTCFNTSMTLIPTLEGSLERSVSSGFSHADYPNLGSAQDAELEKCERPC